MKDFYDIWLLSRQFEFNGAELTEAVRLTLDHRGTEIPELITAFTDDFVNNKQGQWKAFHKRLGQEYVSEDFFEVIAGIRAFLEPVVSALKNSSNISTKWKAAGPWAIDVI